MRHTRVIACLLICVVFVANSVLGQDQPPWLSGVEQGLAKEGWRSTNKQYIVDKQTRKFIEVSIQLIKEETHATIKVELLATKKEARSHLKSSLTAYKVTKREATVNKFANLGEENLFVPSIAGWLTLTFRKGRVMVDVYARSEETAQSVARTVADQIPDKN